GGGEALDGTGARARAGRARVGPGAGVAVVAERSLALRRPFALLRGLVADAAVALIGERRAIAQRAAADAAAARIVHGTELAVVAGDAVGKGVRAAPGGGIADADPVALILRRADDRRPAAD